MDELNLSELRDACLASLYSCTKNISMYFEDEDKKVVQYNNLRTYVMDYCQMELQEEASKKAIHAVESESNITDWDSLEKLYQEKLTSNSNPHTKLDKHPYVKELEKYIKTVQRSYEDQDMDLAITQTKNCYIDPISKKPITTPMRNTICKHVYDKETIETILNNRKNRGCPYACCTNNQVMQRQHLELDKELQLTLQRTQQQSQEW